MILDGAALLLLALLIGLRLSPRALGLLVAAALIAFWRLGDPAPGFGVTLLLGYGLAVNLSGLARGEWAAPSLLASLAAGLLALSGPAGVFAGSTAIAGYGLLEGRRSQGRSLAVAAVLMFVPLTVLGAFAVTALIETGFLRSLSPGDAPFLRGSAPDLSTLLLAMPGLLPLALLLLRRFETDARGALAVCLGGLIASLALGSAAPILPLALAGGLAAASGRMLLLTLAFALGGLALASPAAPEAVALPLAAPWQIRPDPGESLPAWGVAERFAADHPGILPRLSRVDGRYLLSPQ